MPQCPSRISKRMQWCNWSCRSGLATKDAVPARRRARCDRAQTAPSTRSASASEEKRWIMGQPCGVAAPSLTSFDGWLKESFEYRQRPAATPEVRTDGSSREPRGSSTTVRSSGQRISDRREGARRKKFSARTSSGRPRCSRRAGAKRMPLQHLATVTEDYFTKVMVTTRPSRYTFPSFPRSNTNVVGFSVFGSS